jgi:hypothetical protein
MAWFTHGVAQDIEPLVKASAYADKTVWSYHGDKEPLPWSEFKPRDYGSSRIVFDGNGVRPVGKVPAPGVHPRIFFSPEDLPGIRKRLKEDRGGQEAWKNILAWSNALKLTYDENADYAKPDWANGSFHIHGRVVDLHRIGGYSPKRENYFAILAAGGKPKIYEKGPASGFFKPAATEAFRCLIDDDAEGARTLAKATITAVRLEQERRAKDDKPVAPGQPPRPSTSRSDACALGFIYDFIYNWMTPDQKQLVHDELVLLSAWADNYGTFNNAEASRSNWATFSYWVFDLMAIEGEPGFNDLKFLGLYRGWRNFFTYGFFDSGAAYEAEGKLLFGLDAAVAFDRVGHKYGLEPLTHHPLPRAYYSKFSSLAMLPARDKFAVFDILGSMGGGFTTPHDLMIARYLFPEDKTIDFVYRAMVGDDYKTLPTSIHSHWHQAIFAAIFATSYTPEVSPEKLNLPLTFFCGQRALMMTRSSWDKDATMLTMHVRGASGGHPYPDRNGIMLAGQGRTWVTIPGKDIGGWAMNTVTIDEAGQNASTPGRVVDFADEPLATFMTGDSKYCWDWVWNSAGQNRDGKPITREDVANGNVNTGNGWKLVEQCFNDFAWTKSERAIYQRPLKFNAHWLARDGVLSPVMRQPNTPVLKSMRGTGLVRGPRPYVLVIDDIQRDSQPARYDWNLTLPADVARVKQAGLGNPEDIVLAGKASLDSTGGLKPGEPAMLVRVLACAGRPLVELSQRQNQNLLSVRTQAVSPDFKVLLHTFRMGDALPVTRWDVGRQNLAIEFPEQKDRVSFRPGTAGNTHFRINRAGKDLIKLEREPAPLADPASLELTGHLKRLPERLAKLRTQNYHPAKQPGLVAGWSFDRARDGSFMPWPGSVPTATPITATDIRVVEGPGGRAATAVGKDGLKVSWDIAAGHTAPFTLAFWVKTSSGGGALLASNAHMGMSFDVRFGGIRFNTFKNWSEGGMNSAAMLSSWTHISVTFDGETMRLYRNGMPLMDMPANGRKVQWGKDLTLGGAGADASFADLCFYQVAMSPGEVENLYLWGKYAAK